MSWSGRHRARKDLANKIFDDHFRPLVEHPDPAEMLEVLEILAAQVIVGLRRSPDHDVKYVKSMAHQTLARVRQNRTCYLGPIAPARRKPQLTVVQGGLQ